MASNTTSDITVVIPTIPPRRQMLAKAIDSCLNQTLSPDNVIISVDTAGKGAWYNRNQGLMQVQTEWTAFLDDDDWMFKTHLELLKNTAVESGADLVYPWFEGKNSEGILFMGGEHPFKLQPKPELLQQCNWIPITYLVRTEAAVSVGGFPALKSDRWPHDNCEDWGFLRDFVAAGYKIAHCPEKTWFWNIHGRHTSGRPWNV